MIAPKSRVPAYTYPTTLAEQEAALASNPLMQRLLASRASYAGQRHRPAYHYVNPESTLNDPNGLCFWQGRWHLFYQAYPPEDDRQHWGHAVSDDLVHWRDLPYAIYPSPEDKCFSGSTLVEDDRVIAIYHGVGAGNMVATSSDPLLLNWEKVANKAVIPKPGPNDPPAPYNVFDPCIWTKDGVYYSLSAGTKPEGPAGMPVRANYLFRSEDLEHWDYLHPFVEDDHFTMVGDDGACPYFWPIGDRHMLLFYSHTSGGQYLLGDYDTERDKFVVTHGAKFNFGPSGPSGLHAPSATPDGKGGLIVIFNMNPGKPTPRWNQIMTLPRRVTVDGDAVFIEPVETLTSLRQVEQDLGSLRLPANEEVVLDGTSGDALELELEVEPSSAPMVELNVLRSSNREEFTRIAFYRDRGYRSNHFNMRLIGPLGTHLSQISIDTSYSSIAPDALSRAPENAQFRIAPDEPLRLRVFVDRSAVEVFANGRQALAVRVYPEREDSVGVSLRSQGAPSTVRSLKAWTLESLWD